jgi:hypothetical protein
LLSKGIRLAYPHIHPHLSVCTLSHTHTHITHTHTHTQDHDLPELRNGDWLMFTNSGAYTLAGACDFNGIEFTTPSTVCVSLCVHACVRVCLCTMCEPYRLARVIRVSVHVHGCVHASGRWNYVASIRHKHTHTLTNGPTQVNLQSVLVLTCMCRIKVCAHTTSHPEELLQTYSTHAHTHTARTHTHTHTQHTHTAHTHSTHTHTLVCTGVRVQRQCCGLRWLC